MPESPKIEVQLFKGRFDGAKLKVPYNVPFIEIAIPIDLKPDFRRRVFVPSNVINPEKRIVRYERETVTRYVFKPLEESQCP